MELTIYWKAHPTVKNTITGVCKELPDSFCWFYISQVKNEPNKNFLISIPSLPSNNLAIRIHVRDAMAAKLFCHDYLNDNLKVVIEHQIHEMKRRSTNPLKTVTYYEAFLEQRTNRKIEPAPKHPFKRAS